MQASQEEALRVLGEAFGDRLKGGAVQGGEKPFDGPLASVYPKNAEEVELLAKVTTRYSIALLAQGAGTGPAATPQPGSILVRFDLMRGLQIRGSEELWIRAEPGTSLLELDNNLRARGWGLAVYPTSAPRATVGGWLALDGLGVGSFEYGWLSENVLSADVVLPGGERRTLRGEELSSHAQAGGAAGIVVGATLRTRRAEKDVPFGIAFDNLEDLARTITSIQAANVPLWHLVFVNPTMSRARGLGKDYLLFGAYSDKQAAYATEGLRGAYGPRGGRMLPRADAYRVWGERFFPVAPSHSTPTPERKLIRLTELVEALGSTQDRPEENAVQGTVSRSGEVLLLTFDARDEGWVQDYRDIQHERGM